MTGTRDPAATVAALTVRERAAPRDPAIKLSLALALRAARDGAAAERKAAEAIACAPSDARARHVMGFLLRERGALVEAGEHLLASRRLDNEVADPFHLTALTLHALRRPDALAELPPPREPGQRYGERVLRAIAAYEAGDARACRSDLALAAAMRAQVPATAPNRGAFDTYHSFVDRLLGTAPPESANPETQAWIIGDSHSLTLAHRRLDPGDGPRRLVPSLVFGCMAWHLAGPKPGPQSAAFDLAMTACAPGAQVLACFGELDCRSTGGLFKRLRNGADSDVEGAVARLAEGYLARLQSAAEPQRLRVIVVVPPAAKVEDSVLPPPDRALFRAIAPAFAAALRRGAAARAWPVIDLAAETRDATGAVSGIHHVDTSHVLPSAFLAAARRAGFRAT